MKNAWGLAQALDKRQCAKNDLCPATASPDKTRKPHQCH
jgi:hypothetical protein